MHYICAFFYVSHTIGANKKRMFAVRLHLDHYCTFCNGINPANILY
jgi:hypothetical protein